MKRPLIYIIGIFFAAGLTGCIPDSVYEEKVAELAALQAKYDDVYKKYVSQNPSAMQAQGHRIAIQDDNRYNEATVEIALACTRLWFDICPNEWTGINIEAFQKAGYGGHPGIRTILIIFFGILEKASTFILLFIFLLQLKELLDAPDSNKVKEAKTTIAEAMKMHEELDRRMNNADREESAKKYNSLKEIEELQKKIAQVNQIHAAALKRNFDEITASNPILAKLKVEIATMELQKKLFGG